jgi:DNA-binding response OmpR family regulator
MAAVQRALEVKPQVIALDLGAGPEAGALTAVLAREPMKVSTVTLAELSDRPPVAHVLVVLSPPEVSLGELTVVVRWARLAPMPPHILVVAAGGSASQSERALEAGADDAVSGLISAREVVARVRALARRRSQRAYSPGERLTYGRIEIDQEGHTVAVAGRPVDLTRHEATMLAVLTRARGQALSRSQLLDEVWGEGGLEVAPRAVDNLICRLRRRLGDPRLIVTVRGIGFRLSGS